MVSRSHCPYPHPAEQIRDPVKRHTFTSRHSSALNAFDKDAVRVRKWSISIQKEEGHFFAGACVSALREAGNGKLFTPQQIRIVFAGGDGGGWGYGKRDVLSPASLGKWR